MEQPCAPSGKPTPPSHASSPAGEHETREGLTTLEWLLIVAAVAGLAALAIVLVQGVVDDTAEDIRGSSARGQAALVAAQAIIDQAKAPRTWNTDSTSRIARSIGPERFEDAAEWGLYFNSKCRRLNITYSDSDIDSHRLRSSTPAPRAQRSAPDHFHAKTDTGIEGRTPRTTTSAWCDVEVPGN